MLGSVSLKPVVCHICGCAHACTLSCQLQQVSHQHALRVALTAQERAAANSYNTLSTFLVIDPLGVMCPSECHVADQGHHLHLAGPG